MNQLEDLMEKAKESINQVADCPQADHAEVLYALQELVGECEHLIDVTQAAMVDLGIFEP